MARLRVIVYAFYYWHWEGGWQPGLEPGDQKANAAKPVHRQIGFTLPAFRQRGDYDVPLAPVHGREVDPAHILDAGSLEDEYDVVVIGSGAGGGVAARHNAAPGYKVLTVEAGPFYPSPPSTPHQPPLTPPHPKPQPEK